MSKILTCNPLLICWRIFFSSGRFICRCVVSSWSDWIKHLHFVYCSPHLHSCVHALRYVIWN